MLDERTRKDYLMELGYGSVKDFQRAVMYPKYVDGVYGQQTENALISAINVKRYTKNFSVKEFRCECVGKYCCGYPSTLKPELLKNIQSIRDHYGRPITVTCGLRDKTYNSKLGGSIQNSLHLTGQAVDFYQAGVTDTLANRKKSIKWIKTLPNHHYTYGNGINSYGNGVSAPYMGNALHTDVNKGIDPTSYRPTTPYKGNLPSGIVKSGTKGSDAKACQTFLNWCINAKLAVDGIAGNATTKAIKTYQTTYNLAQDGIWGQACLKKAKSIVDAHKAQSPSVKPTQTKKGYTGEYPNTTVKTSKSKASILAEKANEFAYKTNDSKAKYPSGKPTAAYKAGLNKAYPNRSGWGKAPKAGASCDVFVGTCVRCAGVDSKYPRGLSESYTKKCGHFTKVSKSDVKSGDIIFLKNHVCIAYGGKIKEASHGDFYPKTTNALKSRIKSSTGIYRAKGSVDITRTYLKKGDSNEEVRKLQKYLNWFGNCGLTTDGIWGDATQKAVLDMQKKLGVTADGLVGAKTIEAMKKVVR